MFLNVTVLAQGSFKLPNGVKKDKIKFELANNLVIIPVNLNGVDLSFILDTGVNSTIIFSAEDRDSLELRNATKIYLRGLGKGGAVEAVKSVGNDLKIGQSRSRNHTVYLVFDETINFSPQMGFPIHGVIGYDFFKDFILDISYSNRVIKINKPGFYTYKKCRKCYRTKLRFPDNKRPYMDVKHMSKNGQVNLNMLIDSGSGSALWLFENEELGIKVPENSFEDYLGKGFSGNIYGRRSKINSLVIGDFVLRNVTTSFPDSINLKRISTKDRQGSIGGSILRRFNLIVDYPNKKISFKKNGYFDKPFFYNMSGLTIQHNGIRIDEDYVKRREDNSYEVKNVTIKKDAVSFDRELSSFTYSLQPKYEILDIRPNSPAEIAGLKKGDIVLEVNGKKAHYYKLSDLNDLFYSEEGKKIRIKIERLGVQMKYTFFLKKVI
nr:aspartyl protease family protein [Aquimarina sp. MMG016]